MTIQIGDILGGKYRLKRLRGKGGMGSVYEAEHVALGKAFAIKLLHPHYAMHAEVFQRFQLEAQAAAGIGHRGIVDVYDIGQTDDGAPFLVMEFLHGESLAELLERDHQLDITVAVEIVAQTLSALVAVHKKKILHRDLKPENIFLCQEEDLTWSIKILDFGISKVTGPEAMHLTMTGSILGTAHFMSPEQARGAKDVDLRADIWAVGAILFRALTGQLPFDGDSYNEVLAKILSEPVFSSRTKRPEIPETLDLIVLQALAKDRDKRYASAADFFEDLEEFRAGRGETPSPWDGPVPQHDEDYEEDSVSVDVTPGGGLEQEVEDSKQTAAFDVESMDGLDRPPPQDSKATTPMPMAAQGSKNVIPETRMIPAEHWVDSTPSWQSAPSRPDTFDAAVKMAPRFGSRSGLILAALLIVGFGGVIGVGLAAWAFLGSGDPDEGSAPNRVVLAQPEPPPTPPEQNKTNHSTTSSDLSPSLDTPSSTQGVAIHESIAPPGDEPPVSPSEETGDSETVEEPPSGDDERGRAEENASKRRVKSLSRQQIAAALRPHQPQMKRCVDLSRPAPAVVRVRVSIARSGAVSYESAVPAPPPNVSSCLAAAVRGARVGTGRTEPMSHVIAVRSSRRRQSTKRQSSPRREPTKSQGTLWSSPF